MTEAQEIVATLKNIELLIEMGSIRVSPFPSCNDIARIEANLLAWEIMNADTALDALERGVKFIGWIKECMG